MPTLGRSQCVETEARRLAGLGWGTVDTMSANTIRVAAAARWVRVARSTVALVWLGSMACGDDGADVAGTNDASTGASSTGFADSSDDTAATAPPLDDPYGPCAGSTATSECIDAGPEVAECIERDGPGGAYSACAVVCEDDDDCPPIGAGNIPPQCLDGRCLIECNAGGANSCASGSICIDGDPPACMWPQQSVGHPDAQSFCDTACGVCGSTLLLPWLGECGTECLADLEDCSEPELDQVFACTGGEACPAGGGAVATCVEAVACVDGSGG